VADVSGGANGSAGSTDPTGSAGSPGGAGGAGEATDLDVVASELVAGRSRRRRTSLWVALAVGAVVLGLVVLLATSKSATTQQQQASSPLLGKPAPDISGPMLDGGTATLSGYRGKWVLVNFFASWCIPCQQEQGDLVRFQQHHESAGDTVIFGVRFDDPDADAIRSLMTRSGARWPIVDAPDAKIDWGVTGPPESFLVDPNGIVLTHIVGQVNSDGLDALLAQARAGEGR
jgi:cytochrome c biogenesis protein CcmG/thiol:disulfide interchange protein DsbE